MGIGMTAGQYDSLMGEVMAIPEKKRKLWKGNIKDRFGTLTRCVYRDGKIHNWSLVTHGWEEVHRIDKPLIDRYGVLLIPSVGKESPVGEGEAGPSGVSKV